jgi:DNA-binding MarR family transcriptional regulator/N-acetylglutamate synthase-like GNAT family acetyltransferase
MDNTGLSNIESIRRFNRFYTRQIGVVDGHYLNSPFSLTEARVLYELANQINPTATTIKDELGLDAGYLSRILSGFAKKGLVNKLVSESDSRQNYLYLTDLGSQAFATLNSRSQSGIEEMLRKISRADQIRLVKAMQSIENILHPDEKAASNIPFILRPPVPGDMGWVVKRHGELYAQEYQWDNQFEALVAEIVAKFIQNFDAKSENCWIAERDGENIGCIFLVKKDAKTAKLRLLLVDPKARGLGLGAKLINECIRFARNSGYKKMTLWTNSNLLAARHLYQKAGFQLLDQDAHHSFGHDLVGETWELQL